MREQFAKNQSITGPEWTRDIVVLVLLLAILFGFMLGSRVLNTPDEGRYGEIAREMVVSGNYVTPTLNGIAYLDKPPVSYWMQALPIKLFGANEWTLRFPSALLALLGCLIVYITTRRLYDRRTAWLATAILATSPLYFGAAHYVNMDLGVAVFISAALLLFLDGITQQDWRGRRRTLWLAYAFAAIATLTKGLIGIFFPAMIIGVWVLLTNQWHLIKRMRLMSGLLIYAVITVPWFVMAQRANPQFFHYFFIFEQFERFAGSGFNNVMPFWFYVAVFLVTFFPSSLLFFSTIRHHLKTQIKRKESLFFLLWFGLVLLFFSIPQSKLIGYILPIFPPAAILVATYLSSAWEAKTPWLGIRVSYWAAFIITVCAVGALPFLLHAQWLPINLNAYLYALGAIALMSSSAALWLLLRHGLPKAFICATCGLAVFLLTLMTASPLLVRGSIKPLALAVRPMLKTTDKVVSYYLYPEDLAVYLHRQFSMVNDWRPETAQGDNWRQHFVYSSQFQDTKQQMINENQLWRQWKSKQRIYLFLDKGTLASLKAKHTKQHFYPVATGETTTVVTNRGQTPTGK